MTVTGGVKKTQSQYKGARLGSLVMNLLFDGPGNWLVHETCARRRLNVSNWWLARCRNRAIEVAPIPSVKMIKSLIASSSNVDSLVSHIRRSDDCFLSGLKYFKSSTLDTVFDVTTRTDQGQRGAPSNLTKVEERTVIEALVRANRWPMGRAVDKY